MRGRLATAVQVLAALALIIGSFAWLQGPSAHAVTDNACTGAFSGATDEGIDLEIRDADGDTLTDGSEIVVGETLTAVVAWNPDDWTGDTLDRVANCISLAGVVILTLSDEDKPTANDGEWTTSFTAPNAIDDLLCSRARLSGNPSSQNDSTFKSQQLCFEITPVPVEVCDGIDNDGDGDIDEGFDTGDDDGDGTPNCTDTIDDSLEVCDGIDNDGDGDIDEGFDDTDGDGTADCVDSNAEVSCVGSVTVIVVDADTGDELENVTVTIGDDSGTAPFDIGDLSCTTITTSVDTDTLPTGYELEGDDTRDVTLTEDEPDATVIYRARGSDVLSDVEDRPAPDPDAEQPAPDGEDDTDGAAAPDENEAEPQAEVESLALTGMDTLALALLAVAFVATGVGAERLTRRREEA